MKKKELEKLNDIVAGIGLSYLKRNQNISAHSNNSMRLTGINGIMYQQIRNCILLRCNEGELMQTLQRCQIIAFIKHVSTSEIKRLQRC